MACLSRMWRLATSTTPLFKWSPPLTSPLRRMSPFQSISNEGVRLVSSGGGRGGSDQGTGDQHPNGSDQSKGKKSLLWVITGIGIGGTAGLLGKWKKQQSSVEDELIAECAPMDPPAPPPPPQAGLLDALRVLNPPPSDPIAKLKHDFRWTHTVEAVGIAKDDTTPVSSAENRTYAKWDEAAHQLFGPHDFGNAKVHHVILMSMEDIEKDLRGQANGRANYVSVDHQDWIWLNENVGIVTLVYDDPGYRIYSYYGYVLLQVGKDADGKFTIPLTIKFVSDEMLPLRHGHRDDPFITEIIEKFQSDFERWQTKTIFIY